MYRSQTVSRSLSGGNQQKVCLAREAYLNPALLIVSEPTRGIDIGAKRLVLEHLIKTKPGRRFDHSCGQAPELVEPFYVR